MHGAARFKPRDSGHFSTVLSPCTPLQSNKKAEKSSGWCIFYEKDRINRRRDRRACNAEYRVNTGAEKRGYEIFYIGSHNGIERKLIEEYGIPYYGISSGKLRRYFDLKNFTDPFRVVKGLFDAKKLMKKLKPDVVFSKGGFVSVPVVLAAKKCHVPAIIHESDMTPGLANKLCIPSAWKVCCNFPETVEYLPEGKAVLTGSPIRRELFDGNRLSGLDFCNFSLNKPVILIIGGALALWQSIRR